MHHIMWGTCLIEENPNVDVQESTKLFISWTFMGSWLGVWCVSSMGLGLGLSEESSAGSWIRVKFWGRFWVMVFGTESCHFHFRWVIGVGLGLAARTDARAG